MAVVIINGKRYEGDNVVVSNGSTIVSNGSIVSDALHIGNSVRSSRNNVCISIDGETITTNDQEVNITIEGTLKSLTCSGNEHIHNGTIENLVNSGNLHCGSIGTIISNSGIIHSR